MLAEDDLDFEYVEMDRIHTDKLYTYWTWLCWPKRILNKKWCTGIGSTKQKAIEDFNNYCLSK